MRNYLKNLNPVKRSTVLQMCERPEGATDREAVAAVRALGFGTVTIETHLMAAGREFSKIRNRETGKWRFYTPPRPDLEERARQQAADIDNSPAILYSIVDAARRLCWIGITRQQSVNRRWPRRALEARFGVGAVITEEFRGTYGEVCKLERDLLPRSNMLMNRHSGGDRYRNGGNRLPRRILPILRTGVRRYAELTRQITKQSG